MLLAANLAVAQMTPANGLNFKLGDDVATVKAALHTNQDPEQPESPFPVQVPMQVQMKQVLHLRTKGITVTFGRKQVAEQILLDSPFAGSVAGIKLGDNEAKIRAVMGKPIKEPWTFGTNRFFLYALDDSAYIQFTVTEDGGVQAIIIKK
ncbi:hypothetical protein [Herbaspirillum sp. DW155]|uniref:hypothetical protein n=1 Tax=Herbaspirillum sp. DW155 TaxID=3095609 RepID=UPI0030D49000